MFRNTDTKKKTLNTSKIVPNPHDSLCDTDSTNFSVSFISTSNLTMKCDHLTVLFSYKIIGHIVT